ncbi:MAG: ABC transporter permease, partial [Beijerinckiaceae bacterium]
MTTVELAAATETGMPKPASHRRAGRFLLPFALPVGLALLHEAAVRFGLAEGRLLPPPSVILATLKELAAAGELQTHALATLLRVAAGFALGGAAGLTFGALAGASRLVREVFDPTLQALRAVPSIAWVPLFIL